MQKNQGMGYDSKRIAKNTLFLYGRMFFSMVIGLYTSGIVVRALGLSDYGLYGVIGGVASFLLFINNTLTSGTQRFLNFALGTGDSERSSITFYNALILHILIGLLFVIICETVGLWFLLNKINIPPDRVNAAFWVYQISIFSMFCITIGVPFSAAIVAHEHFKLYAYISIFDVCMNLVIALIIQLHGFDRLIVYSCLVVFCNIVTTTINIMFSLKRYPECSFKRRFEKSLFKEMLQFSGWNIMGCAAVTMQNQGLTILINIYFGTIANAARGIANQVNQKVLQFVTGFQTAVNPQIVKLYAQNDLKSLTTLIIDNSIFASFLFLFIAVPVCVETPYILRIWMGKVPDVTKYLVYIIILQTLIQTISRPVVTLVHAVGKMKWVNITAGGALLMILPTSWILAESGANLVTIFIVNLIPWLLETFFELWFEYKYIKFPIWSFYRKVYLKVFFVGVLMFISPITVKLLISQDSFVRLVLVTISSVISSVPIIYYIGLNNSQRARIISKIASIRLSIYSRFHNLCIKWF